MIRRHTPGAKAPFSILRFERPKAEALGYLEATTNANVSMAANAMATANAMADATVILLCADFDRNDNLWAEVGR